MNDILEQPTWPDPNFLSLSHEFIDYPEDEMRLPMQAVVLTKLRSSLNDTRISQHGLYFRIQGGGFLISMH